MCVRRTFLVMKLAEFMEDRGLDDEAMAALVRADGVTKCDRTQMSRYRRGVRRPEWNVIARIRVVTDDAVTGADWEVLSEAAE